MTAKTLVATSGDRTFVERRAVAGEPLPWPALGAGISRLGLAIADLGAFGIAFTGMWFIRHSLFDDVPELHWGLWYAIAAWFLIRAGTGLYYPCSPYPPNELRRSFETSGVALLIHAAVLGSVGQLQDYRVIMLLVWPLALPFTYAFRTLIRARLIALGRYGVPLVVIGNGNAARRAIREMHARPETGYYPVAVFSSEMTSDDERLQMHGVPIVGRAGAALEYQFPYRVKNALLAIGAGWADDRNHELARQLARRYTSLQIFTNLTGDGLWLSQARALGPYLTIQTHHTRFAWHQRLLKRALDIAISLPALLVSAPIILAAAIMIKIVDPGPAFFSQTREGKSGRAITIYKLRSMVINAESQLARYLAENPSARFEYERTMKLHDDPRILPRIGKLIRRSSIDELPQLWSILKGDMSLVGPRIMPTREVDLYSERGREIRREVPPGLTGFWQVEHRNDSDFRVRETADSFYVSNWSVWLDLWIILRTSRAVLARSGAY